MADNQFKACQKLGTLTRENIRG